MISLTERLKLFTNHSDFTRKLRERCLLIADHMDSAMQWLADGQVDLARSEIQTARAMIQHQAEIVTPPERDGFVVPAMAST